jgi:hypothetical protein
LSDNITATGCPFNLIDSAILLFIYIYPKIIPPQKY